MYDDAEKIYQGIAKAGGRLIEDALKILLPSSFPLIPDLVLPSKIVRGKIIASNTVHAPRREVVKVDLGRTRASFTRLLRDDLDQVSKDGQSGYVIADDPLGASSSPVRSKSANVSTAGAQAYETKNGDHIIKNSNVQLTIVDGRIVSLVDVKLGRELIPTGKTGGLVIFDDRPNYW